MPHHETELLNDLSSVTLQQMINGGLNAFAIELVVESYRKIVVDTQKTHKFTIVYRGVQITLEPFVPAAETKAAGNP